MSPEPFDSRAKAPPAKRSEKGYEKESRNLYMKDDVEMCHHDVTKFDSLRVNRDQVMDLETWFKILSLKPCKLCAKIKC